MIKAVSLPKILSITFGGTYFIMAGVPFITLKWIEAWSWYSVILDWPMFIIGKYLVPDLMFNHALATSYCFIVVGTVMYAAIGYLLGNIFSKIIRKEVKL